MPEPVTSLALSAAKSGAPAFGRLLANVGRKRYDAIIAKYTNVFTDHITTTRDRVSTVKNLIYREEPITLNSQYVNISFSYTNKTISDQNVSISIRQPSRYLISGTGGAGKTMFMKWCALDLIQSIPNHGLIPLFFELREISEHESDLEFPQILFNATSTSRSSATYSQFIAGLVAGVFVIILDAVDEINPKCRNQIVASIRRMARFYPNTSLIISSRRDPQLESLPEFKILKTKPMELTQIISVLDKLDYDKSVKDKLVSEMKSGLYEKHKSFLSNPLLATIMLLTYDQSAEIPTKETSFYKQAFEALYQRHDATKGVYKRDHHAGLPMDEFENVFSAFCYKTYVGNKFEFSDSALLKAFRDALNFCGVQRAAELVSRDAMESVCLLQKEGLDNTFIHRSFQEYFCAVFISNYRGQDLRDVMIAALERSHNDKVISMLFEINRPLFDIEYALPYLDNWLSQVSRLNPKTASGLHKFILVTMGDIDISVKSLKAASYHLPSGTASNFCSRLEHIYPVAAIHKKIFRSSNGPFDGVEKILNDDNFTSPALRELRARVQQNETEENVSIKPLLSEAKWLIRTSMPDHMLELRQDLTRLRDEIAGTVEARSASMKALMSKNL